MIKITAQQLDSLTHEVSRSFETQADITISEDDLYTLNDALVRFALDTLGAEVVTEPEPFVLKDFLCLRTSAGNMYGVVAFPKDLNQTRELHGPFESEQKARNYIHSLRREYEDYQRFAVCRIELPVISPNVRDNMLYRKDARA